VLVKLYLIGKKLQALAKKHNSDRMSQSIILRLVSQNPQSVSDIASLLSLKVSAATSKIVEMEKQGLLTRSLTADKRSHKVTITAKGGKALCSVKTAMSKRSGGSWFCLTRRQACILEKLIDRIRLE
jgi:DNA-binding MarR family transcriptional regulator